MDGEMPPNPKTCPRDRAQIGIRKPCKFSGMPDLTL
jgi:hypothetical protein